MLFLVPDSRSYNGAYLDKNGNQYAVGEYTSGPLPHEQTREIKNISRTELSPIKIRNKDQSVESSNPEISSKRAGFRITLPAFTVKVSANQNASQGISVVLRSRAT